MVQTILTPTDGSDGSARAIEQAIELAKPLDARIHAVSVIRSDIHRDRIRYDPADDADDAIAAAEEMVTEAGLEFTSETPEGIPHEAIIACASRNDVDMIVMGTHGRTGLDRVLLGSVAERVVRKSPVPVLTVPPDA